ncbi:TetR family transcriptional regulator C-terminal domain-containing protein [Spiractinospora alimapuensis]|uniref:TetR/AcrR family transcriptional regulator n=1 Tax=Spiractinospora alimapuensis TaxID=2820884 RepID=UPI001F47F997|nr:TetR family transcriptional regulator C-terminal domain-containing protein [Spiractinospora alimapuensis]QVQ52608.1 TetR family transcriptional regulator C-terminal domain-containing protein [Spiractinospora alimapuensis]
MPRVADHELRRGQITRAVRTVAAARGLPGVTVARTAAEAGFSVGLVQHYFPHKNDLLRCAYTQAMADVEARAGQHIAAAPAHRRSIREVVAESLLELLPLDDERWGEQRVMRAFGGLAADDPQLARTAADTGRRIRTRLAVAIANGVECGEVDPDLDPERAALRLQSLIVGLASTMFDVGNSGPASVGGPAAGATGELSSMAVSAVWDAVGEVFPGRCHQYADRE